MKKRTLVAALCASVLGLAGIATSASAADAYPSRDVKIIIPFAPGGATDIIFRLVSEAASKHLGKAIVGMNMGGAGGSKGSTFVKNAAPDGYTLLGGHEFLLSTYHAGMVQFGLEAFEPVCTLTMTPLTIAADIEAPYKSYKEMIEYARQNPGKATITMTPASVGYVIWDQAVRAAGMTLAKNFKTVVINGVGPQTKSMLGHHVQMCAADVPSHLNFAKDGRLRFLAVAHQERLPQIPEIPTLKELGYDVNVGCTRAIFAPKGTPKEVVAKIAEAYGKACQDAEVIKKITGMGNLMAYKDAAGTTAFFQAMDPIYKASLSKK